MTHYVETLRTHNLWRRGAEIPMVDPSILGEAIDTLLAEVDRLRLIESAAANLIKQRGRYNTEIAYNRLAALFAKEEQTT